MNNCITGFNGERKDPISGVTHSGNGYRVYTPVLTRFTCPDGWSPFGGGGINPYAYCDGDPVNRADPSGHMSWQAGLGIGLGILGILGAAFTGGASIAAAGSITSAFATLSAASMIASVAALASDVLGIASAATEQKNPGLSASLGWVSLATGLLSLGAGMGPALLKVSGKLLSAPAKVANEITLDTVSHPTRIENIFTFGRYKKEVLYTFDRVNIVTGQRGLVITGHSTPNPLTLSAMIPIGKMRYLNGRELIQRLKNMGKDFSNYNYAELAMCFTAKGWTHSMMSEVAEMIDIPTIGYHEVVTTEDSILSLVNQATTRENMRTYFNGDISLAEYSVNDYVSKIDDSGSLFRVIHGNASIYDPATKLIVPYSNN